jgi:hypothetical protein
LGIIKSQLLGATYNFTARELGLLFAFFCKIGDVKGVELLLRFASARKISLRINVGNVPDSGLVFLLNYYRVVDPAKSQELAKQLLSRSCPQEVELAAISLLPDDYLGRISTATKHAKHELRVFAIATSSVRFDSQLLQGTLNSCLQHSISAKKLAFFMMSVIHSISSFKSVSDPFVANLIAFFKARESDIIASQVGRCVNLLSDLSSSWRLTAFVTDLLPTVCAISAEGALLYSAASQSKELFELMATKSLRDFFSQRLPSLYCYGFRLLIRGLQLNMPEGSVKSMLKGVLPKLVETFPEFVTIPSIAEASGGFWTIILSMKNFRQRVLSAFDVLMPPLSSPAFPALSFCLPMILLITLSDRGLSDLNKQIMQLLPELLTMPILLPFLRIYLKCSVIRADKMPFAAERLTFLGNTAKSLCGQTLEDCYWISDVLHELFEFALMHGGPKVLINLIKGMVGKIRFFSLLLGLLKLRKSSQAKPVMDPAQFAWDVMAVDVEIQCHLKALELMKEPTQIGFALELAGFDKDCEESEWVVRARTREQEVTEVAGPDPWLDMFQRISGSTFEPMVEAESADGA